MRILLPLILVGLLSAGGFGLFALKSALDSGKGAISAASDSDAGTALTMIFQDLTGQTTVATQGDLRVFVPAAPEGWTMRRYETADGETITESKLYKTMVSKSTTNDILMSYNRDRGALKSAEVITYENGDLKMALRMRLLDQLNERTVRGGILSAISANMSAATFNGNTAVTRGLFAKLDGVEFIQKPRFSRVSSGGGDRPVNYRNFVAQVGTFIDIQIITNASDADVAALFSQLDIAGMNAMLPQPAPEYRAGIGWIVASSEPLSDVPPGPSLATRAYAILNDGRIYSELETETLADMSDGDILTWDDVRPAVPPSDNIVGLLGPEPKPRAVRRMASAMLAQEPTDAKLMNLLREISRGGISSQAELYASRNFRGLTITPEFRTLMGLLPPGQVQAAAVQNQAPATAAEPTGPVIRRGVTVSDGASLGSNCTIELGVRRCVLEDDG